MTAAIDVMFGALEKLGAHSALNNAPPETQATAFTVLQSMIDEWRIEDFDVGATKPTVAADDLNEFNGARSALEFGLMFRLAPEIKKEYPLSAAQTGQKVIRKAKEAWQYKSPDKRVAKKIHGQGNRRWR